MAQELGASHLVIINRIGVGVRHLCQRHGYLRAGSGYVLVQNGDDWWYACAQCLQEEPDWIIDGAVDADTSEGALHVQAP